MTVRLVLAASLFSLAARADFTYEQSSKITGGAMAGMMKFAGAFSAKAREPIQSTVIVKGDRLANISRDRINVIDLKSETMTDIDLTKKTYSTITFAEMAEAMKRMAEKASSQRGQQGADMQFKADVKQTGANRVISGMNTKETVLTLTVEGTDKKSGQSGSMDMQMDMWMAPDMPGYGEVRDFYRRMSQKVAWNPMGNAMGQVMAQNQKGMGELIREMSKLDGIPVLQITRVGIGGAAGEQMAQAQTQQQQAQQQAQQQQAAPPSASDAASQAAAAGVLGRAGRIGALAGGFGGFGRKKKTEQTEAPAETQTAAAAPSNSAPANSGPPSLMELTTELSSFSSSPADASRFEIPSGFKQVESDMKKALR